MVFVPALTNRFAGEVFLLNNGLGRYYLVREVAGQCEYAPSVPANDAIHQIAVEDIQMRRAGGWFGADDNGGWYPIRRDLADRITWQSQTGEQ
jgi:hypothetical protein